MIAPRPSVPPHGSEVLPWVSPRGRRSEISEYTASIPPAIAKISIDEPADLLDVCRGVRVDVGVLERRWSDQVSAPSPSCCAPKRSRHRASRTS